MKKILIIAACIISLIISARTDVFAQTDVYDIKLNSETDFSEFENYYSQDGSTAQAAETSSLWEISAAW